MGGAARLIHHGIDRIRFGGSTLLPEGGRLMRTPWSDKADGLQLPEDGGRRSGERRLQRRESTLGRRE